MTEENRNRDLGEKRETIHGAVDSYTFIYEDIIVCEYVMTPFDKSFGHESVENLRAEGLRMNGICLTQQY
jgi:hypothetical protein